MSVVSGNDAEAPNEWCGRYFKIAHGEINVRAWAGWLYGVDDYKESPKFVIQLAKKDFHTLPGSGKSGWYLDSFWGKWMEKGLSNNLSDMIAIAQKFQHEMESLCTSD